MAGGTHHRRMARVEDEISPILQPAADLRSAKEGYRGGALLSRCASRTGNCCGRHDRGKGAPASLAPGRTDTLSRLLGSPLAPPGTPATPVTDQQTRAMELRCWQEPVGRAGGATTQRWRGAFARASLCDIWYICGAGVPSAAAEPPAPLVLATAAEDGASPLQPQPLGAGAAAPSAELPRRGPTIPARAEGMAPLPSLNVETVWKMRLGLSGERKNRLLSMTYGGLCVRNRLE